MNFLDKAICAVSPKKGAERLANRKKIEFLNSGYDNYGASGKKASLVGWNDHGGSVHEDVHKNLKKLRQRCRDLYMGAPMATGALKSLRTNVIGAGLKLKSQIDHEALGITREQARELEVNIEREFATWAESQECDLTRMDNFYELQQLAFLNWLMSGDVIALLPVKPRNHVFYDLRINLIEADRISTPPSEQLGTKIVEGVEVDGDGEVIAYHIQNTHPLSSRQVEQTEWTRVGAFGEKTGRRNMVHLMNRERIGQRRGVPFLAPVIESLKQITRYEEAELMAAVVSGMFTVFIEKEGDNVSSNGLPLAPSLPDDELIDRDGNAIELSPGSIIDLEQGEKANTVNPGRPNSNFDGFVTAIARQVGSALEIPYELLIKHFTASYSASRGALLEAWKIFRMYRTWMANDFCQPIYEEWLTEAVAKGKIKAPGFLVNPVIRRAYTGAEWNGPAQGLLNPKAEVEAAQLRIENGLSTHEREATEINGSSFRKNMEQLKEEQEIMKEVFGNNAETENYKLPTDGG